MPENTIQGRFLQEVSKLNLKFPVAAISKKTDYNSGIVSEYLNSKKVVSEKFLRAFCKAFDLDYTTLFETPQVKQGKSKEVIPFGKHAPLRLTPEEYAAAFGDWPGLPIYNSPINASFIQNYRDEKIMHPMYYLHDPRFKDCDFGAVITGDSMHDEIRHGDIVICKEIVDRRFIVFGDIYYVVDENGLETCKYVNAGETRDEWLLVPKNKNVSPSPLPKDLLQKLYKVRGLIRGY